MVVRGLSRCQQRGQSEWANPNSPPESKITYNFQELFSFSHECLLITKSTYFPITERD